MSEYGLKIKNFEAGSLYGYNLGIRDKLYLLLLFLGHYKNNPIKQKILVMCTFNQDLIY